MTIPVTTNRTTDGDTTTVKLKAGRYLFAVGGTMGGATAEFKVNVGAASGVPVAGMAYTTSVAEIVWLSDCTAYITVSGSSATTNITIAMAAVALEVT